MTIVSAFLVPGSPLHLLRPDNPPWSRLASGYRSAARALAVSRPDVILLYSTQWGAVLDQLWQTRPSLKGTHVDENWYEYGDLEYDVNIDLQFAEACILGSNGMGIKAKGVDYDGFPIDTGTAVANRLLNADSKLPLVLGSNNYYHSFDQTWRLGEMAAQQGKTLDRRIAVVGVGGLSGSVFREDIDIRNDGLTSVEDDRWNRKILSMLEHGDHAGLEREIPNFVSEAKADMGFKHFAWIDGALGKKFHGARIHAYGSAYGAGAAVVEFKI